MCHVRSVLYSSFRWNSTETLFRNWTVFVSCVYLTTLRKQRGLSAPGVPKFSVLGGPKCGVCGGPRAKKTKQYTNKGEMMNLKTVSLSLLLLWITHCIHTSDGSAGAVHNDLNERNFRLSLDIVMDEKSSLRVKPKTIVDVLVGETTDLECPSKTGEGLVTWWQTPFGSFGGGKFSNNDPVDIKNGTLRILRATSSHTGLYHCYHVDSRGTTVIPYRVNVVERTRPRMTREAETSMMYELAPGVVPSVLVTFMVAFTLGAFSRPYVIRCLQRTRARIVQKRESQNGPGDIALFTMTSNTTPSLFEDSGAPKTSPPVKSPKKWFWSKKKDDSVHVEEADETKDGTDGADGAQDRQEGEETCIQPKRRSRVIKVYNYDEEGKRYDHVTEPEVVVEECLPGPRHRVMSLTRLSAIMSQAETPDFSASRKSTDSSSAEPDNPPQTETLTE
ncbi:uncharacterized protein LOC118818177 [Colossoma macropomum]|uniref:uncharacterized protein LOC118818177 n=1 Tax=Colossoma macropomum TaxID=42526 RepID=UPI001865224A|nr:uncharacterized protein LOC118818177 [Colossoma macropomum]